MTEKKAMLEKAKKHKSKGLTMLDGIRPDHRHL